MYLKLVTTTDLGHENAWNCDLFELGPDIFRIRRVLSINGREFGASWKFNVSRPNLLWRRRNQNLYGIGHAVQHHRLLHPDHAVSHNDREDVFDDEKERRPGERTNV